MDSFSAYIRRHYRLIALTLVLVVFAVLLWALRGILLPFVLGFLVAWFLQPAIDRLQSRLPHSGRHVRLKRVSIIAAIYVVSAGLIALAVYYVITVPGKSLAYLLLQAPELIPEAMATLDERLHSFMMALPPSAQQQLGDFLSQVGTKGGEAVGAFVAEELARIRSSSDMILGFVALPVFLFYLLRDWELLRHRFYHMLPAWALVPVRRTASVVRNVTGRYLQGQAVLGLAVGSAVFLVLAIAGVTYAVPLAVLAGMGEFVPIVGPWLAGTLGVIVVLATSPGKAIWVALGYIVIQLLQNNLLSPRVQGQQMGIHPAIVIVLTMSAGYAVGVLGFLIILPVTMTVVELIKQAKSRREADASRQDSIPF
ncbi:MAG: AI-2E family transporter [Dehalococcoidia bacterium]|nr:AI-2E family transporter [Dehalococcoidia bacterium]